MHHIKTMPNESKNHSSGQPQRGVGKTASVAAVGAILASRGKKVLMVDLDTQANLTRHYLENIPPRIIYHAIREQSNIPIYPIRENLDIVPSGLDMAGIDLELMMMFNRERVLKSLLEPFTNIYDYILLDCPPALGLVTIKCSYRRHKTHRSDECRSNVKLWPGDDGSVLCEDASAESRNPR